MSDVRHNLGGKFERREIALPTGPLSYFVGGEGPPFLHIHGAGGLRVSPALQELTKWFRVYMPLVPGFDGAPFHEEVNYFAELADMMAGFVDQEIGERCDVSGHAFGGRFVAWFAALHGDKVGQLIIQCPSGLRPPGQDMMPVDQYQKGVVLYPERVPDEGRSQALIEANRAAGYHYHKPGKGVADRTVYRDEGLIERLGDIECLTLILMGTRDAVLRPESVQYLKNQLQRSFLVYLYDAGHLIDMDQPERFVRLVRDFLTRGEAFIVNQGANEAAAGAANA